MADEKHRYRLHAGELDSWPLRRLENRPDDGSSSTGYALSNEPVGYYHWLGRDAESTSFRLFLVENGYWKRDGVEL